MPDIKGFEIEGAKEMAKALRGVADGTDEFKAVHKRAADALKSGASPPRVSGKLASSGRTSGTARTGFVRYGKASVPYAGPIHFGWAARGIKANPFLTRARDRKEPAVIGIYKTGISKLQRRHGLR